MVQTGPCWLVKGQGQSWSYKGMLNIIAFRHLMLIKVITLLFNIILLLNKRFILKTVLWKNINVFNKSNL